MECLLWMKFDLYSLLVNTVTREISCYTGPPYNGTRLYLTGLNGSGIKGFPEPLWSSYHVLSIKSLSVTTSHKALCWHSLLILHGERFVVLCRTFQTNWPQHGPDEWLPLKALRYEMSPPLGLTCQNVIQGNHDKSYSISYQCKNDGTDWI